MRTPRSNSEDIVSPRIISKESEDDLSGRLDTNGFC